jgi:5-methylthioadenosine/S-adenosylhomocysteine deaminase
MGSKLLTNGYIVTVDRDRAVHSHGFVHVEGERIAAVGPMSGLGGRTADETIDVRGMLVMPGLVNLHNHHWASLFKNTGEGLLLEPWLDQVTIPLMLQLTNETLRVAAYLGAIEMLRTGTTCSLNHIVNVNDEESFAAICEPVPEVGIRQLVTKEIRQTPDPAFSDAYPAYPHVRQLDEELELAARCIERWDGHAGLLHAGLVVETGANWMLHNATSEEAIHNGLDYAKRRGLKITNHCGAGTPWLSIKEFRDLTGGGDVDYLARLGALADNWVFIHSIWLSPRELDHVARCGASCVTNPVSNAYSCDGIAPVRGMFEAGVNVALGSDGAYVNCSVDMVEQMKFAALIQNVTHFDPTFMTTERVVEMATINGAKAIGLEHEIGSLEPGKRADIAIFDLDKAHATVGNRPLAALVFSAHGTDVDTVLVNGEVVLRSGELAFEHEQQVLADARRLAAETIDRAGIRHRLERHWNQVADLRRAAAPEAVID